MPMHPRPPWHSIVMIAELVIVAIQKQLTTAPI